MGIHYEKKLARLSGVVSVEDAEGLFDWLTRTPKGKLELKACTHLHAANLQVLMALSPAIVAWPENRDLADWLKASLNPKL